MVKIFVGNLSRPTTTDEVRSLFEKYGAVSECDLIKNYGFVHMKDREAAKQAIENLHHYKLHGVFINVEASKSGYKSSTKLHVGNVGSYTSQELQAKFEEYGTVLECDIVKDYAFVHMERSEDAMEAIRGLDGTEFKGKRMQVELSKSRLRMQPGMGERNGCFRCGKEGHWSKECPKDHVGPDRSFDDSFSRDYLDHYSMTARPIATFGERSLYDERFEVIDYYEKYRAGAFGAVGDPYGRAAQFMSLSSSLRDRIPSAVPPYERRPLSTPSTYFSRDRSPLRRQSAMSALSSGYGYERSAVSSSVYDPPSAAGRDAYSSSPYSAAQYSAAQYSAAQHSASQYSAAQYSASPYSSAAARYSAARYSAY